jgi:hypothetical protein
VHGLFNGKLARHKHAAVTNQPTFALFYRCIAALLHCCSHPDKNQQDPGKAEEEFKRLVAAYQYLLNAVCNAFQGTTF